MSKQAALNKEPTDGRTDGRRTSMNYCVLSLFRVSECGNNAAADNYLLSRSQKMKRLSARRAASYVLQKERKQGPPV